MRAPARLAFALIAILAGRTSAQSRDTSKVWTAFKPPVISVDTTRDTTRRASSPPRDQSVDRKDPTLAGVLSFIWPGLGSYYAGANGHGTAHLTISIVTLYAFVATDAGVSIPCEEPHFPANVKVTGSSCNNSGQAAARDGAIAALSVGLVNWVWSMYTAASDARTHNDDAGQVAGNFSLRAAPRGLAVAWRF